MKKVKKFLRSNKYERRLFYEALYWSFKAWFFSTFYSLKYYYSWMGERVDKENIIEEELSNDQIVQVNYIKEAIRRSLKYSLWKTSCLTQAITAKKILKKRGIRSCLYLSVSNKNNQLSAHSWVKAGNEIVFGKEFEEYKKEFFIFS